RWLLLTLVLSLLGAASLNAQTPPPQVPPEHAAQMAQGLDLFRQHVKPLLAERCLKCHGGAKIKGDFDLNTREGLLKGGSDGPAIIPGKSKQSRLVKLVRHED